MNWSDVVEVIDVATRILGAVAIILIWVMSRMFVSHRELQMRFESHDLVHQKIDKELGYGATHFARVDGDLKHAPTHDDLDEIKRDLGELKATAAAIQSSSDERAGRMEHIERTLDRVLQFHLRGGQ